MQAPGCDASTAANQRVLGLLRIMFSVMNGVVIQHFGNLRWTLDVESRDLAIYDTLEAASHNVKTHFFAFMKTPSLGTEHFRFFNYNWQSATLSIYGLEIQFPCISPVAHRT